LRQAASVAVPYGKSDNSVADILYIATYEPATRQLHLSRLAKTLRRRRLSQSKQNLFVVHRSSPDYA
jgi:hypothetical protein